MPLLAPFDLAVYTEAHPHEHATDDGRQYVEDACAQGEQDKRVCRLFDGARRDGNRYCDGDDDCYAPCPVEDRAREVPSGLECFAHLPESRKCSGVLRC